MRLTFVPWCFRFKTIFLLLKNESREVQEVILIILPLHFSGNVSLLVRSNLLNLLWAKRGVFSFKSGYHILIKNCCAQSKQRKPVTEVCYMSHDNLAVTGNLLRHMRLRWWWQPMGVCAEFKDPTWSITTTFTLVANHLRCWIIAWLSRGNVSHMNWWVTLGAREVQHCVGSFKFTSDNNVLICVNLRHSQIDRMNELENQKQLLDRQGTSITSEETTMKCVLSAPLQQLTECHSGRRYFGWQEAPVRWTCILSHKTAEDATGSGPYRPAKCK